MTTDRAVAELVAHSARRRAWSFGADPPSWSDRALEAWATVRQAAKALQPYTPAAMVDAAAKRAFEAQRQIATAAIAAARDVAGAPLAAVAELRDRAIATWLALAAQVRAQLTYSLIAGLVVAGLVFTGGIAFLWSPVAVQSVRVGLPVAGNLVRSVIPRFGGV